MPVGGPINKMNRQTRFHIGYWIAAIIALLVLQYFYVGGQKVAIIPYSQFEELLQQGKIDKVGVSDRYIQGKLKTQLNGKTDFETTRVDPRFRRRAAKIASL
jgi:cell division protease FtsH